MICILPLLPGGTGLHTRRLLIHRLQATGETFSGLHVMCLIYVGFQKVDPSTNLQLPLESACREAPDLLRE